MHTNNVNDNSPILVVGPAWIGDMVMAHSMVRLLKARHPAAPIDMLAPKWSLAIAKRMKEIDQVIEMPVGHGELGLRKRYKIAKFLRAKPYQQAILLTNTWKSALVPFWARIPKRTGWLGESRWGLLNDVRYLDKEAFPLMIQRYAALALDKNESLPEKIPLPHLTVNEQHVRATKLKVNWEDKPTLALCPGAEFGPAKQWPAKYYAKIAEEKLNAGWQVCLFGSPKDQKIASEINAVCKERCLNLTGKTTLTQAIELLSSVDLVVTNDSGLMHIASALERPVVAVFGSTNPKHTPPLATKQEIVSLKLDCSPCMKRECPLQHTNCLTNLKPDAVMNAMQALEATN